MGVNGGFVARPSLSKQIRRPEDLLGVVLLERSTHHVALTAAGEAFPKLIRGTGMVRSLKDRLVAASLASQRTPPPG